MLLCHRRDHDLWNLPGGGLEKGESVSQGLAREVKEETGLKIKIDKLTGIYNKLNKNEVVFSFMCKIVSGKIIQTDESDKIEYFGLQDIPKNISPNHLNRIKDALNYKNKVILKVQI